jgi:uncharacterized protein (DUF486 family)
MKNHIVLIVFLMVTTYCLGQTWQQEKSIKKHTTLSISMDPNANLKSSGKNIALEIEKLFTNFYLRTELRYVDSAINSCIDLSIASGLHFSFLKNKKDVFYGG